MGSLLDNSGTFSSDALNDVFFAPESSQIDDTSLCAYILRPFSRFHHSTVLIIPETLVDGTNNVAMLPCLYDQDEHTGDILIEFSLVER